MIFDSKVTVQYKYLDCNFSLWHLSLKTFQFHTLTLVNDKWCCEDYSEQSAQEVVHTVCAMTFSSKTEQLHTTHHYDNCYHDNLWSVQCTNRYYNLIPTRFFMEKKYDSV